MAVSTDLAFLSDGGETGALIRAHDWTTTPLGPPEGWPQSLRSMIGLMLASNQAMFLIWGPERIKFYNDAYAPVLGKRHPAAMGARFNEIWTDILHEVGPLADKAYAGESTHMENMPLCMFRNGYWEDTYFTFFYTPIRKEDGKVGGMFCACADTTAQVLAEKQRLLDLSETQRIERARRRLAAVVEQSADFIGIARPNGQPIYVNEAGLRMMGLAGIDDSPDSLIEFFVPEERRFVQQVVLPAVQSEGYWEGDLHFGHFKTGEKIPVRYNIFPVLDETQQVIGYATTTRDQREQKRAAAEAAELAAERAAILGQLAEGVIVTDAQGRITYINDAAEALHRVGKLGTTPDEYQATYNLYTEDGQPYPFDELPLARAALKGETIIDARWRIHRHDGSEVIAIGCAKPLVGPDGQRRGAVLTVRDDTARYQAQNALRQLNETLEHKVMERTAELERAQSALRQSQKMEAVGQLTGGLAHDFNNLLQAINGHLQLIRHFPLDAERVRQWADNGLRAVDRGAKLTSQLLAFSRLQRLELKPVSMENLVNGMADMLMRTLGPSIEIDLDLQAEESTVLTDPTQLEMALLNLAINARDAMPGGGALRISTTVQHIENDTELAPGDYVALSIADTGSGMSSDVQGRAFDPFYTTKGVGKGTGLGLSQVYGFARQAGGTARLVSQEGQGTTVTLLLRQAQSKSDGAVDAPGTMRFDTATRTGEVLIVDDDNEVREILCEMLSTAGFTVRSAIDGPSALDQVLKGRPDLLLLDFAMPGMNGAEMAATVRKTHPQLPIIFSSGYADTSSLHAAVGADATVLRKPFQVEELLAAIDVALKNSSRPDLH